MRTRAQRYRVTVVAHRRFPDGPPGAGGPGRESGVVDVRVVRSPSAAFARDLALLQLHTESALAGAAVGADAVLVERLRWGRSPVRDLDSRRVAVVR